MKQLILCSVFCALCSIAQAANDFSADANCVALYNQESGALTTDSKSTNTLTNSNVTADTTNYKQGSAGGLYDGAGTDQLGRTDADLTSGFPCKSGTSNTTFSVVTWIRTTQSGATQWFIGKVGGAGNYSFYISIDTDDKVRVMLSSDGTAINYVIHDSTLSIETWYCVAVTFSTLGGPRIRIHDESVLLGTDKTAGGQQLFCGNGPLRLGYANSFFDLNGNLDETVVLNDVLTTDEIDQIWSGTYGATAGAPPQIF